MTKIKSYVKQALAHLKGDDDAVIAQRNYRRSVAAVKGQRSALESKLVTDETRVEIAKEKLLKAKYPGEEMTGDAEDYLSEIYEAEEEVEIAETILNDTATDIDKMQSLLDEFEKEEEV